MIRSAKKYTTQYAVAIMGRIYHYRLALRGYKAVRHPYNLLDIDPESIKYMISSSKFGTSVPTFGVVDGDWDHRAYPFETNAVYDMFERHFINEVPWEETETYKKRVAQLKNGNPVPELDAADQSIEKYDKYLQKWDEIYKDMEENGYRRYDERERNDDFIGRVQTPLSEIEVLIGRDGKIICKSGKHRVTCAKLLGINRVPARVIVRHARWQEIREEVSNHGSKKELPEKLSQYENHPDLTDVI